jgi:predicted dehydrogenase
MTQRTDQFVRVGVIGLGFMGATHVNAYRAAARDGFPCALVAVCDTKESRRRGIFSDVGGNIGDTSDPTPAFDPKRIRAYAVADELLADREVDLVSICTHTDTHVDLAVRALRAGKHVLVEKPVALTADEVRRVRDAAREAGRLCMPAMCMRFWPAWAWLKQRIDDRSLGRCTALTLTRLGSSPAWSRPFYGDLARSGGALVDLHVHDADFVYFCFGRPESVYSVGDLTHLTTAYQFPETPKTGPVPVLGKTGTGPVFPGHVVAEGAWLAPGSAFRMRYVGVFERATVDYDLGRDDQLLICRDGRAEPVEVSKLLGYDEEVRHLVSAVARGARPSDLGATLEDAVVVTEMLDAERRSIESRQIINL